MSSYLAGYGEGEERKAKLFKLAVIGIPAALLLGVAVYFFARHFPQRQQLGAFLDDLQNGRHPAAYARFGCTAETPCRDYKYENFLRDFGPQGEFKNLPQRPVNEKWSCEGGIIRGFDVGPDRELVLFIAHGDSRLSYAPPRRGWRGCTILP
jgi:hypothetical protein